MPSASVTTTISTMPGWRTRERRATARCLSMVVIRASSLWRLPRPLAALEPLQRPAELEVAAAVAQLDAGSQAAVAQVQVSALANLGEDHTGSHFQRASRRLQRLDLHGAAADPQHAARRHVLDVQDIVEPAQ